MATPAAVQGGDAPMDATVCEDPAYSAPAASTPSAAIDMGGSFTENLGQWEGPARFVAESTFGHAVLCDDGVTYDVVGEGGGHRVKVAYASGGPVEPEGVGDLGYDTNFFLGSDPDQWVTGARSYREVLCRDVWPGVDVRYYFSGASLKYDVLVGAQADPSVVRFDVEGDEGLKVSGDRLDIRLSRGLSLHDGDLAAWYGDGEAVDVSFRRVGDGYGFAVDKDPGRPLVIDPMVVHSSTLIGGAYDDTTADVEVDAEGNIYIVTYTGSDDFPVTPGAYDEEISSSDVALTKLNHNCSEVLWSTFVGGTSWDFITGLEVDKDNNLYFTGNTWSADFPMTAGAICPQFNLGQNNYQMDFFVAKLSDEGDSLLNSTYIGGSHSEYVYDIKVRKGRVALVGSTHSVDFPTEYGSYGGVHGDAFLIILNKNLSRIVDTNFWGGFGSETAFCLEFDRNDDIVVGGRTTSMGFYTTAGAFQRERPSFTSGFVARYSPSEETILFSTYLGGDAGTSITDITVDDRLDVYVAGFAASGGAPGAQYITTPGAFDREYNGFNDAFLAKLNHNGTALEYCTLLGGDGDDDIYDIELNARGELVVAGTLESGANYTVTPGCHDPDWSGDSEGFIFVLDQEGIAPVYSSFHGGDHADGINAIEVDSIDNLVVAGGTDSKDFPINESGYQRKLAGDFDGFVSIVGELRPTSEPYDLVATGHEGIIELEWKPPRESNGYPVRRYLLHRGTSESTLRPYQVLDPTTSFVDRDVEWGVDYHYALYASNGKGISPRSNVANAMSVTVPDPPVNMTGTVMFDSVVIEWEPPGFTGGLPITRYLLYRTAEGHHLELVTPLDPGLVTYEDLLVEDGTNYTYTMTAVNDYGESRSFATVKLRTHDVPTPPRGLNHTYGDLFIRLTWEPPEDDMGLPVTGYIVYRGTGEDPMEAVGRAASPALAFVDDQVAVGTPYRYHVTAENAKGESGPTEAIDAMAKIPPGPPTAVEATATEHFIRITWSPPTFDGASTVLGYNVYLGETPDDSTCLGGLNLEGPGAPQLAFLHDVPYDGVVRHYFVTAVNAEGESGPSGVVATEVYQVPGAPGGLEVAWGDGDLSLCWTAPGFDGGTPIVRYTIYRSVEGGEGFLPLVMLPPDIHAYLDADTANGVEHAYRVTATNLAGESEPCAPASGVPAGPPGAPVDLVAAGGVRTVRLTWGPPSDDGGHPVAGYLVYRMMDGGEMVLIAEPDPGTTELEDADVEVGRVYTYRVKAVTDAGESAGSEVATAIPIGPPGEPLGLVALWMDGYVQLTWSAPLELGGSPITGYRVYRHDREQGNWTELPATGLSYMDDDVSPGRTYNYTVWAINKAGEGPGGSVDLTVPLPPPEPPESPQSSLWSLLLMVVAICVLSAALLATTGRRRRSREHL